MFNDGLLFVEVDHVAVIYEYFCLSFDMCNTENT